MAKTATSQNEKTDEQEFLTAISLGFESAYTNSKKCLKQLIFKETDSRYPALSILMYDFFTKKELKDNKVRRDEQIIKKELAELLNELENKTKEDSLRPFGLKLKAREAALDRDYQTFSDYNNQLITAYPNSVPELTSLYDEIAYQVEMTGNLDRAKELLARLDAAYPEEELTLQAHLLLGEDVDLHKPGLPQPPQTIAETSTEFKLMPAVPNPFNPTTTIEYQLSKPCFVELTIYNSLGQKVATLVSKKQPAGNYKVVWNASSFSNGVYIFELKTEEGIHIIKKLILLK